MFDENIQAKLVFDGKTLAIPKDLLPKGENPMDQIHDKGQLSGSVKEQLCELAGRCCYDSLGQGRNSKEYWEHIRQVKHFSVIEHAYYTVNATFTGHDVDYVGYVVSLLNRRGIYVEASRYLLRVTLNLRAMIEWDKWTARSGATYMGQAEEWRNMLYPLLQQQAPLILPVRPDFKSVTRPCLRIELAEPESSLENHVSFFLSGSRGWSHEQVRHRENISQRSTRYVDEDDSPWVEHPLVTQFFKENHNCNLARSMDHTRDVAQDVYAALVSELQPWLVKKGVDKLTARKQARGAARGFLGNALRTEMIFTVSVDGWKEIIRQRLNAAADAEIRWQYSQVLKALKESQFAEEFKNFGTEKSPDGMGEVLMEKQ
jgi:thymidylate synthase ThyX